MAHKKYKHLTKDFIYSEQQKGKSQLQIAQETGCSQGLISKLSQQFYIHWDIGVAGRNQNGNNNPNFKNGLSRATLGRRTKAVLQANNIDLFICNRCGLKNIIELPRHHKDRNKSNNQISNLEVLCVACHNKEHMPEQIRASNGTFICRE